MLKKGRNLFAYISSLGTPKYWESRQNTLTGLIIKVHTQANVGT